eukprot:1065405-Rhodomonas_salina.1
MHTTALLGRMGLSRGLYGGSRGLYGGKGGCRACVATSGCTLLRVALAATRTSGYTLHLRVARDPSGYTDAPVRSRRPPAPRASRPALRGGPLPASASRPRCCCVRSH